jgi:hypothetical protein
MLSRKITLIFFWGWHPSFFHSGAKTFQIVFFVGIAQMHAVDALEFGGLRILKT